MSIFIYACIGGLVLLAVMVGLWERGRLLKKSEESIRQLLNDAATHRQSEEALRIRNEQLEARLEQLNRQIAYTNEELQSFLHPISHDVQAPLRAIEGFADILRTEHAHKLDPEMMRLFGRIEFNARRMSELTNSLLAFATINGRALVPTPVDMDSLVRSIVRDLTADSAASMARIHVSPLPAAAGDPSLLRQVWTHLIGNALKFSRGTTQPEIDIGGRKSQDQFVYFVRDNGVGFDMKYSDRLFQLFQKLHGTEQFEGTGAGLAIVQRIIHRHGGLVWAEGRRGEGATFSFALPHDAYPDCRALAFLRNWTSGKLRTD